jgi:glycosyltransferase involved in cell wall biosynthesis
VPDEKAFVLALQRLYIDKAAREQNAKAALECAQQPRYRWQSIGNAWLDTLNGVFAEATTKVVETNEEAWADLGRPAETPA